MTSPFGTQMWKRFQRLVRQPAAQVGGLLRQRTVALPGSGAEVTGVRDYVPGDDYRHVDWRLCARRDELLTRLFARAETRPIYLIVDCSRSMSLGTPPKFDAARHLAGELGCAALAREERVNVTSASGRIVADVAGLWGRAQAPALIRFLDNLQIGLAPTDLAAVAERFARRAQQPGPVILLSDLLDPAGFEGGLERLKAGGYDPRVVHLFDPREADPQHLGDVELLDVETEELLDFTLTPADLKRYRQVFGEFLAAVRDFCKRHEIPCLQVPSHLPRTELSQMVLGSLPAAPQGSSAS